MDAEHVDPTRTTTKWRWADKHDRPLTEDDLRRLRRSPARAVLVVHEKWPVLAAVLVPDPVHVQVGSVGPTAAKDAYMALADLCVTSLQVLDEEIERLYAQRVRDTIDSLDLSECEEDRVSVVIREMDRCGDRAVLLAEQSFVDSVLTTYLDNTEDCAPSGEEA